MNPHERVKPQKNTASKRLSISVAVKPSELTNVNSKYGSTFGHLFGKIATSKRRTKKVSASHNHTFNAPRSTPVVCSNTLTSFKLRPRNTMILLPLVSKQRLFGAEC